MNAWITLAGEHNSSDRDPQLRLPCTQCDDVINMSIEYSRNTRFSKSYYLS